LCDQQKIISFEKSFFTFRKAHYFNFWYKSLCYENKLIVYYQL